MMLIKTCVLNPKKKEENKFIGKWLILKDILG